MLPLAPAGAAPINNGCRHDGSNADLNGDGFDDAVVGDPYATVNGKAQAGAVVVLFGDADGRIGEGQRRVLTQASFSGSNVESGDRFGWSVAIDDATMDFCADLLIGSPGEDWNGQVDAGIVQLITFTPDLEGGPGTPSSTVLTQGTVGGGLEAGDQFGSSVAIADHWGDEVNVAVGAPGEDVGSVRDAGAVHTFAGQYGTFRGSGREKRQGGFGMPGVPEEGDRFGASLIAGLVSVQGEEPGEVFSDWSFIAGAPGDVVNGHDGAGSVTTWSVDEGVPSSSQITQDSPGVAGAAEAGDQFGSSLARSRSDGQLGQVMVVGTPGEDIGRLRDAGSVHLLRSQQPGLQGFAEVNQNTPGVPGAAESGDRFGHSVAMRSGGTYRLAIGVPYEDVGGSANAGVVQEIDVPSVEVRELVPRAPVTESTTGTPGTLAAGNRFGLSVAAVDGRREAVLLYASPYQKAGSVFVLSDTPGPTGSLHRSWVPGKGGVPVLSGPGRFGWSMGSLPSS